jgi:hypothetical protein
MITDDVLAPNRPVVSDWLQCAVIRIRKYISEHHRGGSGDATLEYSLRVGHFDRRGLLGEPERERRTEHGPRRIAKRDGDGLLE